MKSYVNFKQCKPKYAKKINFNYLNIVKIWQKESCALTQEYA